MHMGVERISIFRCYIPLFVQRLQAQFVAIHGLPADCVYHDSVVVLYLPLSFVWSLFGQMWRCIVTERTAEGCRQVVTSSETH